MPKPIGLQFDKPGLFVPSVVRNARDGLNDISSVQQSNFTLMSSTSLGNTASFLYSLPRDGLKSTQQLNINWESFENHTFFNSAQVKTQVAFDKIINQYPFDGTKKQLEEFFISLTGFEKYVYDNIPKHKGYLFFSGTNGSESSGGTFITTKDISGVEYPLLSQNRNGSSILDSGMSSMTFEFFLFLPPVSSSIQTIFQKVSGSSQNNQYGITIYSPSTSSITNGKVVMGIVSGSYSLQTELTLSKNQFNHIAFVWNRNPGTNKLLGYLNQTFIGSSSAVEIGKLNYGFADILFGSGSSVPTLSFIPQNTLSGALDEFRVWHSIRTNTEREECERKSIFSSPELKLYYKFNEPSGSNSAVVLDSSGNSLHGNLSSFGFISGIRNISTSSIVESPMTYEKSQYCPILFPQHPGLLSLRTSLLARGYEYDDQNPNLITRLIPRHYLLQGQSQEGLETEEGTILTNYSSSNEPKTLNIGNTQVLLSLLWTWAKYFDELKLFIQSFSNVKHVDYDSDDTIPDQFLQNLSDQFGINLPSIFDGASIPQFIEGENLSDIISTSDVSLQYIQNQIWRRVLINLKDVFNSKGTIHSIKSFIRSVGIDPDNNFRIREYGGPTKKSLSEAREIKTEVSTMLNFISGGFISSSFLSSSRVEPGLPLMRGTFINGISNQPSDGLFTSGSWTYETIVRFNPTIQYNTQSICRIHTTGSAGNILVANLIAASSSIPNSGTISLYFSPNSVLTGSTETLSLVLTGANDLFDGNTWNVSFGRDKYDLINSQISSSYFIRCAKSSYGEINQKITTSSFIDENKTNIYTNIFSSISSSYNTSGTYIAIGSQSINDVITIGLNNSTISNFVRTTNFNGKLGHIRFWSKGLTNIEWEEHVRNFKSFGVENPLTNFNFTTNISGSFQKLRMDVSTDQFITSSDTNGKISLIDFSQNNISMSGSLFPLTKSIIEPQRFYYGYLSPKFDESATTNKVRVRSFLNYDNILENPSYAEVAPIYSLNPSEEPTDNTRFSIDFSIVDALNQDIMNVFATLDSLDNILGSPELMFSPDYPGLENLREIYFNRLTDKINFKNFFDFYKWFDTNIGMFIESLIPKKTVFHGINFLIESSVLERAKLEYQSSDIYISEFERSSQKGSIFLALLVGDIRKF